MVTTIQPRPNLLPATGNLAIEGMETLDQTDLILPRKTIVQATSKREGADEHLGWFFDNLSQSFDKTVEAVILRVTRSRTLFSGELNNNAPECQSYDGVSGSQYGACQGCDFNRDNAPETWSDKSIKRCDFGYLYLCCNPTDGDMFLLGASKTSLKPAKLFNSELARRRRPTFSVLVSFEAEKVVNDKGKYFVLKPRVLKHLDEQETAAYRELSQAMAGVRVADIEPETEGAEPAYGSGETKPF